MRPTYMLRSKGVINRAAAMSLRVISVLDERCYIATRRNNSWHRRSYLILYYPPIAYCLYTRMVCISLYSRAITHTMHPQSSAIKSLSLMALNWLILMVILFDARKYTSPSLYIFNLNETNHFGPTGNVSSHFTVLHQQHSVTKNNVR